MRHALAQTVWGRRRRGPWHGHGDRLRRNSAHQCTPIRALTGW